MSTASSPFDPTAHGYTLARQTARQCIYTKAQLTLTVAAQKATLQINDGLVTHLISNIDLPNPNLPIFEAQLTSYLNIRPRQPVIGNRPSKLNQKRKPQ